MPFFRGYMMRERALADCNILPATRLRSAGFRAGLERYVSFFREPAPRLVSAFANGMHASGFGSALSLLACLAVRKNGAEALGIDHLTGSVEIGKSADLVIVEENPSKNLSILKKVLEFTKKQSNIRVSLVLRGDLGDQF